MILHEIFRVASPFPRNTFHVISRNVDFLWVSVLYSAESILRNEGKSRPVAHGAESHFVLKNLIKQYLLRAKKLSYKLFLLRLSAVSHSASQKIQNFARQLLGENATICKLF